MSRRGGKASQYKGTLLDSSRFANNPVAAAAGAGYTTNSAINMEGNLVYPHFDMRSRLLGLKVDQLTREAAQFSLRLEEESKRSVFYADNHPDTLQTLQNQGQILQKATSTYIERYSDRYRRKSTAAIEKKYTPKTLAKIYFVPQDVRSMNTAKKEKSADAAERKLKRMLQSYICGEGGPENIEEDDDDDVDGAGKKKRARQDNGDDDSSSTETDEDKLIAESDAASDDYTMDHFNNGEDYEQDDDLGGDDGGSY